MNGNRAAAVERAYNTFDDGRYLDLLQKLVAIPTESQVPARLLELYRYCSTTIDLGSTPRCWTIRVAARVRFWSPRAWKMPPSRPF
jgi:hypothetical protein